MRVVDNNFSTFLVAAADAVKSANAHEELAKMFVKSGNGPAAFEQISKASLEYGRAAEFRLKHERFLQMISSSGSVHFPVEKTGQLHHLKE